jgi:hypothetical protein
VPGSEDNFLTNRKVKLSLFLNIKNLEEFNGTKEDLHKQGTSYREVVNKSSERKGLENGIIFTAFDDNKKENQTIYVVHHPNQIKSATDNIGTYSESNDIRYSALNEIENVNSNGINVVPSVDKYLYNFSHTDRLAIRENIDNGYISFYCE